MKQIASFTVNHDLLDKGVYISRIDGDAVTYDIRMKKPNAGDYISPKALHTIEHLLATFVRNSEFSDGIIYAGPMGCRTGFYLVARDSISKENILELLSDTFRFIADFSGKIPGSERTECGNYLEHDLNAAKHEAENFLTVLETVTTENMNYKE
ncbi:S-ribosylhomocysteine lyase [Porcipelethomonas sp.]|uniref:S-ribosylhomocysteine lyase n=1 Tax=Porcipelethomonas sp. TaxID=2981675 RepID=UPI003EF924A7